MRTVTIKTCDGFRTLEWHDGALLEPCDRIAVQKNLTPAARIYETLKKAGRALANMGKNKASTVGSVED